MTSTASFHPTIADEGRGYRYRHGDRPLEGYTVRRAAGRGGFGEVYFAVSDGGREVALKVVQAYADVELRGIGQCMNLKSPHLVTVFDVRNGIDGQPIVIMEYVGGPSLRELLDDAPSGLGAQKAAFFLREIGKGLTYLHDCGIVHRDLKPANIFYENGCVKIGDYGLSKAITASHRSEQTMTVGTVHYMAPEVGAGRYDRSIDIYALGALLYEMLTGSPPFHGASAAEVLMKHLGTTVDVTPLPEPFATVVARAMAKDPSQRYATVQEMVEAVFGAEHVRQSVSVFSPDSLTMVAGRVAPRGVGDVAAPVGRPPSSRAFEFEPRYAKRLRRATKRFERFKAYLAAKRCPKSDERLRRAGERFEKVKARLTRRFEKRMGRPATPATATVDRLDAMPAGTRWALAAMIAGLVAVAGAVLDDTVRSAPWAIPLAPLVIGLFVSTVGAAYGVRWVGRHLLPYMADESGLARRLAVSGGAIIGLTLSIIFIGAGAGPHQLGSTFAAIFLGALMLDWESRVNPLRAERLAVGQLITAAILAFALSAVFGVQHTPIVMATLCGSTLVTGILSPWVPPAKRPADAAAATTDDVPPPPMPPLNQENVMSSANALDASRVGVPAMSVVPRAAPSFPGVASLAGSAARFVGTLVAMAALLPALASAVFLAADVPGLIASGRLGPQAAQEMAEHFQTQEWPSVLRAIAWGSLFVSAAVAALFLMLARRRQGGVHMMRGLIGLGCLVAVPFLLASNGVHWPAGAVWGRDDWWRTLRDGAAGVRTSDVLLAVSALATGGLLVLWPASGGRRLDAGVAAAS